MVQYRKVIVLYDGGENVDLSCDFSVSRAIVEVVAQFNTKFRLQVEAKYNKFQNLIHELRKHVQAELQKNHSCGIQLTCCNPTLFTVGRYIWAYIRVTKSLLIADSDSCSIAVHVKLTNAYKCNQPAQPTHVPNCAQCKSEAEALSDLIHAHFHLGSMAVSG